MRLTLIINDASFSTLLKRFPSLLKDFIELKKQAKDAKDDFPFKRINPRITDIYKEVGTASGHYFHQDLLVARKIFKNNPVKHVDIGSRIDGFIAHVASFREIEVLDIRDLKSRIKNITYRRIDITDDHFDLTDYCDSVSCLHALEHFGLGRYGDRIDYNGHLKGWQNIHRMLKKGGKFYFSVPIGEQRIEFNAHRIFSARYLLDLIQNLYIIDSFHYVNDQGDLIENAPLEEHFIKDNFSCHYGLAIFELTKK